ncbi:MAG: carboxyltransferase domain-containing protein, partial [Desulfobacteraceae bacterium]|nr:carboxyltransferase domain-containing protein [Desulfobacteraceae bacterium]
MMGEEEFGKPVFRIAGDRGFIIEFGQGIDPGVNAKVMAMAEALKSDTPQGILEIIPT